MLDVTSENLDLLIKNAAKWAVATNPSQRPPAWSDEEIRFLRENAGKMDDAEIAVVLGRTRNAVKVFRVRQGLQTISMARTEWLTANVVARMLGLDSHKIVHWCRAGMIQARKHTHEPSGREYFLINRDALTRWCVNPDHWVYFDWHEIVDEHLHRLCELRAQRWNDEWWTTSQVAQYHHCEAQDVKRFIQLGRLQGYRLGCSLGGRHFGNTWRYWFVRKSEATKPGLVFKHHGDDLSSFTPRADAWILRAHDELGLPWIVIGRMMGSRKRGKRGLTGTTISTRYKRLMGMIGQAEEYLN